jgi:hypothetical protein
VNELRSPVASDQLWRRRRERYQVVPMKQVLTFSDALAEVHAHLEGPFGESCSVRAVINPVDPREVVVQSPMPVARGILTLTYRVDNTLLQR